MSDQSGKTSTSEGELRERRPVSGDNSDTSPSLSGGEDGRIGVLDVVKAIAPLLIIIALALGMLVLGYAFLPETLSTSGIGQTATTSSVPSQPVTKEDEAVASVDEDEDILCSEIDSVRELILALDKFSKWKELGSKLGMSEKMLGSIEADNKDVELRKRAMLRAWFDSYEYGACWHELIDALILLSEVELAKKIALNNDVVWID